MPIGFPTIAQSKVVRNNTDTISTLQVNVTFTGSVLFYVSADNGATWEQVVIAGNSGQDVSHSFTATGTKLLWKGVGLSGDIISRITIKVNP